jgi:hypothetical protein
VKKKTTPSPDDLLSRMAYEKLINAAKLLLSFLESDYTGSGGRDLKYGA